MSEEDIEIEDSTNPTSDEDVNTEEVEETVAETETEDDPSELLEKNKRLFERAKKAEAEAKALKAKLVPKEPTSTPSDNGSLSTKDLYALMEAKVPQDDVDEVAKAAKILGVPIAQALKTNVVRTILAEKAEERRTADATSVGTARRGTAKVSDETLLEKATSKDEIPDSENDLMRLAEARLKRKR